MRVLSEILFIFLINFVGVSSDAKCDDTKILLSKCDNSETYQWLVEVPKTERSCEGKSISAPKSVPCDFDCPKGQTFDKSEPGCKECSKGTFSLGGGFQYTFSSFNNLSSLPKEFTFKTESFVQSYISECRKKELWQIKGNVLQGDVQPNCIINLVLRFKLVRPGSIKITYNLATSYVFASITSRCDFAIKDKNNYDRDNEDDLGKTVDVTLQPTGYGIWKTEKIEIDEAGDYKLSLEALGFNAFHFPVSIRSIVVQGTSTLQDCIPCPPGTSASKSGSHTCKPCPANTYAAQEGSDKCISCAEESEYSDEGSTKCLKRPICEAKHYRKVFTGCDISDTATVKYEAIQPKICMNGGPPPEAEQSPCGTCNPGMYKKKGMNKCEFCPPKTYSNGTLNECLPCGNDLSLLPGLYYQNWNELPIYLNRSYMSFDDLDSSTELISSESWIPSISYIASRALPDTLSILSLIIAQGFRPTEIAKSTKGYGTLYFKFSIQCQSSCELFLVSQDVYNDDDNSNWQVLNKWKIETKSDHKKIIEYTYSIQYPDEIVFNWLFTSADTTENTDEIRIYEIRVTNTKLGGSDRCVSCLTTNNQETECKACAPGHILSNNTCIRCPPSTIASRVRSNDLVPTVCTRCTNNTISDDGITCYVPCKQAFDGNIEYDLNEISTIKFHGSKLFTQKGSGYFHIFNASICGKTSVTCSKTSTAEESKRSKNQMTIDSRLCRMGSVPDKNDSATAVAYIDDFGEQLLNVSSGILKYLPPLRSDYNLTDIILVYFANVSASQSSCSERITYLSLRCDHTLEEEKNQTSSLKYKLQTPNDCATGTCDGCTFYFLLRTPFACPICDETTNGFRTLVGPCEFGRQVVRQIPYEYCAHNLIEKAETRRCSNLSTEIQIIIGLFIIIAGILISVVIFCWRKNRKLEYRYMQLIENNNPDDDTPVDNVCAQLSDEDDSAEEVQFKTQSKAKRIMNVVRKAIRKNPTNGQSDMLHGDSFLLSNTSTNEA